jgi:hypothetical protein
MLISFVFFLASCVSKTKLKKVDTYFRFADIEETSIRVTPVVVDLCIDFDNIVAGKSKVCLTEQEALDGAQYDALTSSKDVTISVLVSPIYFVTREETIKKEKSTFTYTAEVMAFSGTYCQQYNMLEALEKVKPMSRNLFVKESLMKDFPTESFGIKDVLISDVYIIPHQQKMDTSAVAEQNAIDVTQDRIKPELEDRATQNSEKKDSDTVEVNVKELVHGLSGDSLEVIGQVKESLDHDSSLTNQEQEKFEKIDSLDLAHRELEKDVSKQWNEERIDKTGSDSVKVDKTTGRLLLDEHFKSTYYQNIVLDSASNIVEEGKEQIDFIMHNDDYISRWMRENITLRQQLIMFKKILVAEESFMDIKYKKERTPEDDRILGALDLELLEYEYLNRKKLLFYSNFNFQRSKKLILDCYVTCHDTLKPIVQKYIELADYMLAKDLVPMQVNSADPLMVNGLPLRRKLNAEFFASELYIRGWEICSGMRKTFGEYPILDLYQADSLSLSGFPSQDTVKFEQGSEKEYVLKGYNSQRFFQKEFPVNSFNYLMQFSAHLPDTLKQAVFKTFKNPSIDEDAVFAENVQYPSGLIYVIQVGAFRKPIPVSFYKSFAPVVKEYKSEGVYRYTAGFFPKYNSALIALKQIKSLGYKDAFIVALQDGKRIEIPKSIKVK